MFYEAIQAYAYVDARQCPHKIERSVQYHRTHQVVLKAML